jgi:hypothetical protein
VIIRRDILDRIRDGRVGVAFRRWMRPTVRAGGTLLTAIGQLEIAGVEVMDIGGITGADARRAGCASRDELVADLERRHDGRVYRHDVLDATLHLVDESWDTA